VFAVRGRQSLIQSAWEDDLYGYIGGILKAKGQKPLAINGMPNHIHLFVGMKPNLSLSDLVREIKKSTNNFINEKQLSPYRFQWQEGFGAFSYHQSQIGSVIKYVQNQKMHHASTNFKEEYDSLLKEFQLEPDLSFYEKWWAECAP
jgi:REP element-mobilizing transposase RayT